ncbi:hypothetical protein WP12_10415 [Sphingomonas sp. SRS2]|nr:hypothetical protein WP12_10415 [Sphingomonas sp. SRS2]
MPEFEPLRLASASNPDIGVTELSHYTRIEAKGDLLLRRRDAGLGKAVWYGALTGGYLGTVVRFDDDELRISDD